MNSWKDRQVFVDDVVCGELGENNNVDEVNVICPAPLRGQSVMINAIPNPNTYSSSGIILCEVMIYGYKYGGMYLSCKKIIENSPYEMVMNK